MRKIVSKTKHDVENLQEFLTLKEFCDWFDIHPTTLHRWINEGLAPERVLVGRKAKFRRTDVQKWLRLRTRAGR